MRTKSALPSGWNKKRFNNKLSYEKRIKYASDRAIEIGSGSSRLVFEIKEGRKSTALKIAVTKAGVAQNKVETNPKIHSLYKQVVVPLIGYDKASRNPIWAHFEKVKPFNSSTFKKVTGFFFREFTEAVYYTVLKTRNPRSRPNTSTSTTIKRIVKIQNSRSKFFKAVVNMTLEFSLEPVDYMKKNNWGIYKGKPVLIDFGYSKSVVDRFYRFCL